MLVTWTLVLCLHAPWSYTVLVTTWTLVLCLHAPWSYTVLVTTWTHVLMSACPLIPYRAGYCMDIRLGICMPHDPRQCWLRHGHTPWHPVNHRCLHTPLSHTVLVTSRTYVLVSAHPSVPYRTGYCMDIRLGVCTPFCPIPYWLLYGLTSWCLHTPLSHTVLVIAWTYVLVSACPMILYRAG